MNTAGSERIVVRHRDGSYAIEVGDGALGRLGEAVLGARGGRPPTACALVTDEVVGPLVAERARGALAAAGIPCALITVPAGEATKSWAWAGLLLEEFSERGMGRDSVVVALGGGVVGDLAGFAAATYLRGVPVFQVPTTLLAMVDSSIGGKTGVDLPRGKNLAGAFWPPAAVVIDPSLLATLPESEWRSGFGEVVKSAALAGEVAFELLEREAARIVAHEPDAVGRAVLMCVHLKSRIVEGDERESDAREALNYGHTLAHALERELGYGVVPHGVAVADGMRFAARLAVTLGVAPAAWAERQERLLDAFGLARIDAACDPDALLAAMHSDKKARSGQVRMVLSTRPGAWETLAVDDAALLRALQQWCGAEGSGR